jgi:hypothetical protein
VLKTSQNKNQQITITQGFALGQTIGMNFDIKLDMSDGKLSYRELWHKTLKERDHLEHTGIDGKITLNGS